MVVQKHVRGARDRSRTREMERERAEARERAQKFEEERRGKAKETRNILFLLSAKEEECILKVPDNHIINLCVDLFYHRGFLIGDLLPTFNGKLP